MRSPLLASATAPREHLSRTALLRGSEISVLAVSIQHMRITEWYY